MNEVHAELIDAVLERVTLVEVLDRLNARVDVFAATTTPNEVDVVTEMLTNLLNKLYLIKEDKEASGNAA